MNKLDFLTKGTLRSQQLYRYKTRDGKAVFTFSYEYEMGYYDIVIHDHPSYNGRTDDSCTSHWLPSDLSPIDKKICFTVGKEPKTLDKAKKISMEWSELVWTYILTGITIDEQLLRRN